MCFIGNWETSTLAPPNSPTKEENPVLASSFIKRNVLSIWLGFSISAWKNQKTLHYGLAWSLWLYDVVIHVCFGWMCDYESAQWESTWCDVILSHLSCFKETEPVLLPSIVLSWGQLGLEDNTLIAFLLLIWLLSYIGWMLRIRIILHPYHRTEQIKFILRFFSSIILGRMKQKNPGKSHYTFASVHKNPSSGSSQSNFTNSKCYF